MPDLFGSTLAQQCPADGLRAFISSEMYQTMDVAENPEATTSELPDVPDRSLVTHDLPSVYTSKEDSIARVSAAARRVERRGVTLVV